jgi:hypothetical protein
MQPFRFPVNPLEEQIKQCDALRARVLSSVPCVKIWTEFSRPALEPDDLPSLFAPPATKCTDYGRDGKKRRSGY